MTFLTFLFSLLDDPTVQGLDRPRHLQTGEMIIIVVVLLMWAGRSVYAAGHCLTRAQVENLSGFIFDVGGVVSTVADQIASGRNWKDVQPTRATKSVMVNGLFI